jgi:two-component system, response regulator PdtaR
LSRTGAGSSQPAFAVTVSSNGRDFVGHGRLKIGFSPRQGHYRSRHVDELTNGTPAGQAILVVENNELLKLFMVNLVEKAGFVAIQASNADEALPILECRSDIALMVTNIVMQGSMNGADLAHAVDNRWPSVKIIVVSGQRGLSEQDLPAKSLLLSKPYHNEELVFEIRSLIEA